MPTYQPTFESVKAHLLPDWYQDAKFGIFIHWGIYSVPAFAPKGQIDIDKLLLGEGDFGESPYTEWYQNSLRTKGSSTYKHHLETYGADFRYEGFAPLFNQEIKAWDPVSWADLFASAGARYVVLVSKHHDGFLMWDSDHRNPRLPGWQASRDIAGELTEAVSARGMKMGFYYSSLLDWSFTQRPITSIVDLIAGSETSQVYVGYVEKHWYELIERYDPWILWGDIGYPPGYTLPELFAYFYNRQPEGVVNDRWLQLPRFLFSRVGRFILKQMVKRMDTSGTPQSPHSDFITPEYATLDHITDQKWETCRGIGNSFGYNQFEDSADYQTGEDLIRLLVDVVSKNGNLLLNVGPCPDGSLHPAQVKALEQMGAWLEINGEAIYGTRPWTRFGEKVDTGGEVRYTSKDRAVYAIIFELPSDGELTLPKDTGSCFSLLETGETLLADHVEDHIKITLPASARRSFAPVIKIQK
jgi:alpha-L-fucosidase